MRTAVVLFTRDLRVHDNAALAAAADRAETVVPLFVLDDALLRRAGAPNRVAFLLDALHDLDSSLCSRGSALVVRRGDAVAETMRVALAVDAEAVYLAEDVSAYARARERRLRQRRRRGAGGGRGRARASPSSLLETSRRAAGATRSSSSRRTGTVGAMLRDEVILPAPGCARSSRCRAREDPRPR